MFIMAQHSATGLRGNSALYWMSLCPERQIAYHTRDCIWNEYLLLFYFTKSTHVKPFCVLYSYFVSRIITLFVIAIQLDLPDISKTSQQINKLDAINVHMFGFKDFFRNVFLTLSQNVSSQSWQMEVDMKVYFLPVRSFSDKSPFMFEKPRRAAQSNYLFLSSVHFLETSQVYFLCILMPLQVCPTTTPHTHT